LETRLYLIRHAESEGNANKVMQGGGEYPLSGTGRAQAEQASGLLRALEPTFVASSDLSRAVDTAILAIGRVDLTDPRLRERSAGPWEGKPRSALEAAHPGALDDDALRPAGFEPAERVLVRMLDASRELLTRPGNTIAFTHGAVLRILEADLGGTGRRFAHLEALILRPGLTLIGRDNFLVNGEQH